jgi:alpha-beta hydrolase superfamily lysophospholipase
MRRIAVFLCAALLAALAAVLLAGEVLTRPAARGVGMPPPGFDATTVRIPLPPSDHVAGWMAKGVPGAGAVLLLHGVRADRTQMLDRARALHALGFSVLLIDLPAHGESPGARITFGAREGAGVLAALSFLRGHLPGERVGVVGVSLGAASLVLARPRPAPDAVVLESMYPTMHEAVANRLAMRLGRAGAAMAPLLLWQMPLRLDVGAAQLRPIDAIAQLGAPVLLASGTHDVHTTWPETERLFEAAVAPKELWAVQGAAHRDLHAHDAQAYEARVFPFLARHLRTP